MVILNKLFSNRFFAKQNDKKRLCYITNIPTPYRKQMMERWAQLNPDLEITTCYTDATDQGRGWSVGSSAGIREKLLPVIFSTRRYGKMNRHLVKYILSSDVIMIGGFEQISYLVSATIARIFGKRVILLFDGFSPSRFGKESLIILMIKRLTALLCHAFFANGKVGEEYLRTYIQVPSKKLIFNQFLSHNEEYISTARLEYEFIGKSALRVALGLTQNKLIFICCGYLIQRKRLDVIIHAFSLIPVNERPLLLVVGDGPLHKQLLSLANHLGVDSHFAGFKQGMDLAKFYFASDAMILASEDDPWGLVVNEAMSAGLPIIVSDACGAAQDLVENGKNGFIFSSQNVSELSNAIMNITRSNMSEMGNHSRRIISAWTTEASAKSLSCCIDSLIKIR